MAINTRSERNLNSPSDIANRSFDSEFDVNLVEPVGFDGIALQRTVASSMASKITTVGLAVYVGIAAPGTAQATALWQCKKVLDNGSGTVAITWADGNSNFDNIATDLTALSYS